MDAKVSTMVEAPKQVTAGFLIGFFNGEDAAQTEQQVAKVEGGRLAHLYQLFANSDHTAIKEATKGMVEDAKTKSGDKSSDYRVATVRASNIKALYGAWRHAEFNPVGKLGFLKAYAEAVKILKERGIKWDGTRKAEKWETDVKKAVAADAEAKLEAELAREKYKREHNGEEMPAEEYTLRVEQAQAKIARAGAVDMAKRLLEKQGADFCLMLAEALYEVTAEQENLVAEQSKAEVTAEQRKAA